MCFARESRLIVRLASAVRRAAGRTPLKRQRVRQYHRLRHIAAGERKHSALTFRQALVVCGRSDAVHLHPLCHALRAVRGAAAGTYCRGCCPLHAHQRGPHIQGMPPHASATHCLVDIPGSTFLSRMCAPAGPDLPQNTRKDETDGQEAGA